jgi:hypothetical protein
MARATVRETLRDRPMGTQATVELALQLGANGDGQGRPKSGHEGARQLLGTKTPLRDQETRNW